MITIKEIAKIANVSPTTVSRVINGKGKVGNKCRKQVQKIIDEVGYRPNINARALAGQKTELMGIVTPNFSSPFYGSLSTGVSDAALSEKYRVLMSNSNDKNTVFNAIDSLKELGCENIILHNKMLPQKEILTLVEDTPGLVVINRHISEVSSRCVWLDNSSAGRTAAEFLYNKGHRKIAIINSDRGISDAFDRLFGITHFYASKGIQISADCIKEGIPSLEGGKKLARELIDSKAEFTALIAYNDMMAVGAMNELQDMGIKVPEDVSVMGFDDVLIASTSRPGLTTMHYPIYDMGQYATQLSIQLTHNDKKPVNQSHQFMATLVERDSVKDIS
ncbi:LacI family DNA-binding transcriptional regulator [Pseudocolwellia sp. HL-MZ7]|uniref:LacI family DNA-binding transcriptional regulator n=1 Tax=Pseudocolwellia sp. HL-MZ7 TaxID=3400627 RepID=UPI003CEE4651